MTELLERVLSIETLRRVIRQKRAAGVSKETISLLTAAYAEIDVLAQYASPTRPGRLPVELIRPDRRNAFLEALQRLPVRPGIARTEIASLRH